MVLYNPLLYKNHLERDDVMNLLAHLYLSNGINDMMFGNYIADSVKGRQYLEYPEEIQKGILLHRAIDTFTDKHPLHKQSRDRFRSNYGLFSGVVIDIVYDHYLAKNWALYSSELLSDFAKKAYDYISLNETMLPSKLKLVTPHMIRSNWILMYQNISGIERVLAGMSRNTSLPNEVRFASKVINREYKQIEHEFMHFFSDLRDFTKTRS